MNAYTIVEPTNRKPRRRRSADSASDTGVVAGMSPAPAVGGRRAGGGGTIVARYASNEPNSARDLRKAGRCRSSRRSWRGCARSRRRPSARSRSASSKAATTAGSKPRNAARKPSRLRRIVDHDRPAWNDSRASRSNSSISSVIGHAPLVVVVRDHHRVRARSRRAGPRDSAAVRAPWLTVRRVRGRARARRACSAGAGPRSPAALKTERKTSPETFFVPAEPMSVTLRSAARTRPDRAGRAAISVPTFVRASVAKIADSWARGVGLRRPRRVRRAGVVGRRVGRRSIEPRR